MRQKNDDANKLRGKKTSKASDEAYVTMIYDEASK
jgi:hypothetical protein